jgi:mannosyltransferase
MTAQEAPDLQLVSTPLEIRGRATRDRLVVGALVALSFAMWAPNLGRGYWIDEGISVGIASHPLHELPGLLREDGSPPLFYVLLHFWMSLFGTSEVATHALTLGIALAAIPAGYWCGRELFGRRAGVVAAALFATSPFLGYYSTETRMYPLVVLLSTLGVTFAWRAVRDRRWRDGVVAVAAYAALLYTHDWGIYLVVVSVGLLLALAFVRGDRRLGWAVVGAAAAVVALWAPWVPWFLGQASNTAAPWAVHPQIGDFFADPATALGGTLGFLVAPALALGAFWTRRQRSRGDAHLAGFLGAAGILTALAGWLGAQLEPSWTVRYLAVIVGPLLLGSAGALAPSRTGRRTVCGVCVLLACWSVGGTLLPNPNAEYTKSNVAPVARGVGPRLSRGDLVIVTQSEQLAVVAHYLPAGLVYVTPTGPVKDPTVVDWRNLVERLQAAEPCTSVAPSIDALPVGARILVIDPAKTLGASGTPWSRAVNAQVAAVDTMVNSSRALEPIAFYNEGAAPKPFSPVDGTLFEKTTAVPACG